MYAIECQNLSKTYQQGFRRDPVNALQNVNLTIEPCQVYGFLGSNGAGKTTTIRLMLDLIRPTGGAVRCFGESVRRNPAALKNVGALVEGASFYPYLSAWDNLRVFGWTHSTFDESRARRLLDAVDLTARAMDKVGKFSTGMRQRLGIAAALLHDPQLVILDEPTSGLDPAGIRDMRHFIRQLVDEEGKTVFLSSHLLSEVEQICDRVAIINRGQVIVEGRVDELLRQHSADQLLIEAEPLEKVKTILAERWQVSDADESGRLIVQVRREDVPAIVRLLVDADVSIYDMQRRQLRLEEFFLSMTAQSQTGT